MIHEDQRIRNVEQEELTERIIGCAMHVHTRLGSGYLESVYQRALAYELGKAGLQVQIEKPISVCYDGVEVGAFFADMLIEETVLIEIKAAQVLHRPMKFSW